MVRDVYIHSERMTPENALLRHMREVSPSSSYTLGPFAMVRMQLETGEVHSGFKHLVATSLGERRLFLPAQPEVGLFE